MAAQPVPGPGVRRGATCYSFTFALNPTGTPYATQPEILEYMRKTVTDFDLWPHIRLNTGIASAAWDDDHRHLGGHHRRR